jgi:hypothetical protein
MYCRVGQLDGIVGQLEGIVGQLEGIVARLEGSVGQHLVYSTREGHAVWMTGQHRNCGA